MTRIQNNIIERDIGRITTSTSRVRCSKQLTI